MSRVDFTWLPDGHDGLGELAIAIDGEPLPEILRRVEEPFTSQPGELAKPGGYSGIVGWRFDRSVTDHFEGGVDSHMASGPHDKTVLASCECGEVGCWPLMASVSLHESAVVWRNFENPHRTERSGAGGRRASGIWNYGELSFTFDRAQYMESLRAADAAIRAWRNERGSG